MPAAPLPTNAPPAPPPPAAPASPVLWGTPPPPGSAAWPYGAPPVRSANAEAIREVRRGVAFYRWAALLSLLLQGILLAEIVADPTVARFLSSSSVGGVPAGSSAGVSSGGLLAFSALAALLGLCAFVLGLLAFLRWRAGVHAIARPPPAPGTFSSPPLTGPAKEAADGYRYSTFVMLAILLAAIAGVVAIVAIVAGSLAGHLNPNGTYAPPTSAQVNSALSNAFDVIVGLAVVDLVLGLLLAYFVTRSLAGFLRLGSPNEVGVVPSGNESLVYAAVLLGAAGSLNYVVPGLGGIAALGPVLLFVASQRYLAALDVRLLREPGP